MVVEYNLIASYQRLDELAEKLKVFSYRVLKEDCLDLPEKVYTRREVELTEEQSKAYATMKSAALALLKGKMATAPHVLNTNDATTSNYLWSFKK